MSSKTTGDNFITLRDGRRLVIPDIPEVDTRNKPRKRAKRITRHVAYVNTDALNTTLKDRQETQDQHAHVSPPSSNAQTVEEMSQLQLPVYRRPEPVNPFQDKAIQVSLLPSNEPELDDLFQSTAPETILQRMPHQICAKTVSEERCFPEPSTDEKEGPNDQCIVLVTGLIGEIPDDLVRLYFEHPSRSGGGHIENFNRVDHSSALITFTDEEAMERVLQKRPHEICGKTVSVERYFPEPSTDEKEGPNDQCIVLVTGLIGELPDDLVRLYFEHRSRSGGGHIENFNRVDHSSALITFTDEEDAEMVLSRKTHTLDKFSFYVRRWENPHQKTIKVFGFKPFSLIQTLLELYFSNPEKSGGGDIETVKLLDDGVTALVTFSKEKDCKEVLKRGEHHTLAGAKLSVSLFNEIKEKQRTLEVSGFSSKPDREFIDLFFDKVTKSDGCVEDMKILSSASVLLTFSSIEDAEKVVTSAVENPLTYKGCPLQVQWVSTLTDQPSFTTEEYRDTIIVSGSSNSSSLENYFTNHSNSGGGEISVITASEDETVLIKFSDPRVVPGVLSRKHELSGRVITVREYHSSEPFPIDPRKLFVANISLNTREHCLLLFIENICGHEPTRIFWETTPESKSALILFEEEIDAPKIRKTCENKKLDGNRLTVNPVLNSRCIRVTGFTEHTTEDYLRYYFSNKTKSGGGEVTRVSIYSEDAHALVFFGDCKSAERAQQLWNGKQITGETLTARAVPGDPCIRVTGFGAQMTEECLQYTDFYPTSNHTHLKFRKVEMYALVHFKDYTVAERVVMKSHILDGHRLRIGVHYDCLGSVSVKGGDEPFLNPVVQLDVSAPLSKFFQQPSKWKSIQSELENTHSSVSLATGYKLCLTPSYEQNGIETCMNRALFAAWRDIAKQAAEDVLGKYAQLDVQCSPDVWADIKRELGNKNCYMWENCSMWMNDQTQLITIAGEKQLVEEEYKRVVALKTKFQEKFDEKKKFFSLLSNYNSMRM